MCPILIAEDTAYQQNSYVSPAFGRRHLAPLWHAQTLAARQDGACVFFHSDGNINHFLPLIVEAGFDGLQGIEPAAGMDICGIRQTYIRSLCLMGNLNPALFSDSSVESDGREISARPEIGSLLQAFRESGVLILGSCSGLHAEMSP